MIPVKDLAKYDLLQDKTETELEDGFGEEEEQFEEQDSDFYTEIKHVQEKQRQRQLMVVYVVYLAEAYVIQPIFLLTASDGGCCHGMIWLTHRAGSWLQACSHSSRCYSTTTTFAAISPLLS